MKSITKEVKIGITGVAALFILIYGINYLKGINIFKPTSYLYVKFKNVEGLTVSSPVFADGYHVGVVRELYYNFDQSGNIVAEIDIDPELRVPKGSVAELSVEMLGGAKLNLLLANNPREKYESGDTITGVTAYGTMEKVAAMMPKVEQMLPKLDSILTSLNTLLADPALANSLHNVEHITANVATSTDQLQKLMKNDIPQLTGKLNVVADNCVLLTENLKTIDFAEAMKKVDATLANVKSLTDKLSSKDNSLGLLFNDTALYENLNATSQNAASLLQDLQAHPKRYVHFSLFGRKDK